MMTLAPLFRTAVFVFVLDQVTKLVVVHALDLKTILTLDVIDPFVNFRMAWNEGINFGIPLAGKWVLIILALIICAWILYWMFRDKPGRWTQFYAGLVIGGAIGNVLDRIIYGAVADFLNMSCCGWANPWSFNVADIAIFIGAIGLIFATGRDPEPNKASEAQ